MNVPFFESLSQKKFLTRGNDKFYFSDDELYMYNGENNYFSGVNYVPLAVGNCYIYKRISYSSFGSSSSYFIKKVNAEMILRGKNITDIVMTAIGTGMTRQQIYSTG